MTEEEFDQYKVSIQPTGERGLLPDADTVFTPECAVPDTSMRILRSALLKMFAAARAIYDNVGHVEGYWILLSNRPDLTVTDIIIPEHVARSASVDVEPEDIDSIRNEIRQKNDGIEDNEKKWKAVGWGHSHANMSVFFSGTDWNNQQGIINDMHNIVERFGQKYTTVYGMTVNVRNQVYAEILSRMKCKALIRQKGAVLKIIEDVDVSDEEIKKQIYDEILPIVQERVSTHRTSWRPFKKGKSQAITDYMPDYGYSDASDISADDLVDDINNKVRSSKDILALSVKGMRIKKLLTPASGKSLANILLRVMSNARKIILDDVEKIIMGEDIDSAKEKIKQTTIADSEDTKKIKKKPKSKKKYEIIIDTLGIVGRKCFSDFEKFIIHAENVLDEDMYDYVAKNKTFIRDKLEHEEYKFNASEEEIEDDKQRIQENLPSDIKSYSAFIEREVPSIQPVELSNIRVKLHSGISIAEIAEWDPEKIEETFEMSKNGQLLRDKTRHYIKEHATKIKRKSGVNPPSIAEEDLAKAILEKRKKREEEYGKFCDFIIKKIPSVIESDRRGMMDWFKQGHEIQDILSEAIDTLAKVVRGTKDTAKQVIKQTKKYLAFMELDNADEDEISDVWGGMDIPDDMLYLEEIDMEERCLANLVFMIDEGSLDNDDIASMETDELVESIGCDHDVAQMIIDESKHALMDRDSSESDTNHSFKVSHFIDPIPVSWATRQKLAAFIEDGHFIYELSRMTSEELIKNFECKDWEPKVISDTLEDMMKSDKAEPELDAMTTMNIEIYTGIIDGIPQWDKVDYPWDSYMKDDGIRARINGNIYTLSGDKWILDRVDDLVEYEPSEEVSSASFITPEEEEVKHFVGELDISAEVKSSLSKFLFDDSNDITELLVLGKKDISRELDCDKSDAKKILKAAITYTETTRNAKKSKKEDRTAPDYIV